MSDVDYQEYVRSNQWKVFKKRYRDSGRSMDCYVCKKKYQSGFSFHHLTYIRLGKERLDDVVVCCPSCHKQIHKIYSKQKKIKRTLLEVTQDLSRGIYRKPKRKKTKPKTKIATLPKPQTP